MNKKKINLCDPNVFGNEIKYLNRSIKYNQLATGNYINKFERAIKKYTSSKYAASCINGTSALHISLKILGIKKNNEVIVPTLTFIATINTAIYNSAIPIFMDADNNFNIDQNKCIDFINTQTIYKNGYTYNKKTGRKIFAIIITHIWGNAALIDELVDICRHKNIKVLEDASESLGTIYKKGKYKNKHTGTIGDIGCISFNGNKIITSAGGGMIITNNKEYFEQSKFLSNQCKLDHIYFKHTDIGYNYRLSNIHSAIGLAQYENLNKILKLKKNIHNFYCKEIDKIKGLKMFRTPNYSINNNWMNILILDEYKLSRDKLLKIFLKNMIEVRPVWYLNHQQKMFKKYQNYKIYNAKKLLANSLCLPSSSGLLIKEIKKIINILKINA